MYIYLNSSFYKMGNTVNLLVYLTGLSMCPTLLIHYEDVIIVSWKTSLQTVSATHPR